jgi:elongation factor G
MKLNMKDFQPNKIKTIALLGHQGSGKTSLIESFLYTNKLISKKGTVDEGNTQSDFTKEEKNMKVSIYASVFPIEWQDYKYNFIDTPGFLDFIGEVNGTLKVAQSAILLVDGSKGVEVGTRKMWRAIRAKSIPSFIFVNKLDKTSNTFKDVLDQLRSRFGKRVVPLCWPIGKSDSFDGFINVIFNLVNLLLILLKLTKFLCMIFGIRNRRHGLRIRPACISRGLRIWQTCNIDGHSLSLRFKKRPKY